MKRLRFAWIAAAALLLGSFAAAQDPVRVGSKDFTENILLGQVIVLALENAGIAVEDRTNLGGTFINRESLLAGEIDVYPDYNGTAISNFFRDEDVDIPEGASGDPELSYQTVAELDRELNNLIWLEPAPANNTYVFAVQRQWAEENDVFSAADLADFVQDGGFVRVATNEEFAQRPDGMPAFENTYDFEFSDDQLLIISGATPAQTSQALNEGANDVNVAMVYGTDGALLAYDFVLLSDEQGAQPVFNPAPIFRGEVIDAYPEIPEILNPIFEGFTADVLQELNARVEVDGESPQAVARDYLTSNGYID